MRKNFLGLLACLGLMIALPCCKPHLLSGNWFGKITSIRPVVLIPLHGVRSLVANPTGITICPILTPAMLCVTGSWYCAA